MCRYCNVAGEIGLKTVFEREWKQMFTSLCSPPPGRVVRRQALRLALVEASISLFVCRSGYALCAKPQCMDTRADVSTSYRLGCTPQAATKGTPSQQSVGGN